MRFNLRGIVLSAVSRFIADLGPTRGAAIAFYAVTALTPVIFILLSLGGLGFGHEAAHGAVADILRRLMERQNAELVEAIVETGEKTRSGLLGAIISAVVLLISASGVFSEVEDALNIIWQTPRRSSLFWTLLRARLISLALVLALGLIFLTSMVATALLAAFSHFIEQRTAYSASVLTILNLLVSFFLLTLLFATVFKIVPNKALAWRDVVIGGAVTALLFEFGQTLLGLYFGILAVASAYGAASGLMLLLLWAYYSALVFLIGAEFTRAYVEARDGPQASLEAREAARA